MSIAAGVAGVAGLASVANAVHVNPEGTGQVLIYPYYTAHKFDGTNSLNTTYSIVNTTNDAKAVKVRFLEGANSLEVLDFNIYMSAFDVWTGVIGAKDNVWRPGNIGGAHATSETTCAPFIDGVTDFRPFLIETVDGVSGAVAVERSLDGYMEVLEMGTLNAADEALVDHGVTGVPTGCDTIEARWRSPGGIWLGGGSAIDPVSGGLFGGATILDVTEGYAMSYNAIALEDFWGVTLLGQHTNPGDLAPSLRDAAPLSRVFKGNAFNGGVYDGGGYVLETNWLNGIDAVSALFMTSAVMNEYVYDEGRDAKTEWVITFPTKREYVVAAPTAPFSTVWDGSTSCDNYEFSIWDREEQVGSSDTCGDISPIDPNAPGCQPVICYEANVVEFLRPGSAPNAASQILGSDNLITILGPDVPHATPSGWASIRFEEPTMELTGGQGVSYRGLPAVGFMVQRYTNSNAQPGLLAQYAASFNHVTRVSSF